MDIFLFVLRTMFLILIYVFIFILLIYLIRDLQKTQKSVTVINSGSKTEDKTTAPPVVTKRVGSGLLLVESEPRESGLKGLEIGLPPEIKFGRGPDNDVVLPDRFASIKHSRLFLREGQYWLEDLGSKNGTFLNGRPLVGPAVLANGDLIKIGDTIFRFVRWGYEVESDHRMRSGTSAE